MYATVKNKFKHHAALVILGSFLLFWGSAQAEAHYFSIIPQSSGAPVGKEHTVLLSFTHVFTESQFSARFLGLDSTPFSANFLYADGTKTAFPAFDDYDDPKGIETKGFDAHISKATPTKNGTIILESRCAAPMGPKTHYFGYSKQILNAQADNFSTRTAGGSSVLEIIPLTDLAGASVNKSIRFKVLYKGQPLHNAEVEWADEKSPVFIGDEGRENLKELGKSDSSGTFSITPKNAGMSFLGVMHAVSSDAKDRDTDYYSGTFIFNVKNQSVEPQQPDSGSSSGGCSTGAGIPALLALLAAPLFIIRREK